MHCTTLHCTTLHCNTVQGSVMEGREVPWSVLHCSALYCPSFHCTALSFAALHCTALHCTDPHCTALHCPLLHYSALLCSDVFWGECCRTIWEGVIGAKPTQCQLKLSSKPTNSKTEIIRHGGGGGVKPSDGCWQDWEITSVLGNNLIQQKHHSTKRCRPIELLRHFHWYFWCSLYSVCIMLREVYSVKCALGCVQGVLS